MHVGIMIQEVPGHLVSIWPFWVYLDI